MIASTIIAIEGCDQALEVIGDSAVPRRLVGLRQRGVRVLAPSPWVAGLGWRPAGVSVRSCRALVG